MRRIFEIRDDFGPRNRWFLGAPIDSAGNRIDPRLFTEGKSLPAFQNLFVPVKRGEVPLDFTLGSFEMPIVHRSVAEALSAIAPGSIERFPVTIEPQRIEYEILNVISKAKCLDEASSEIVWWTNDDGRPDKVGCYRGVGRKVIRGDRLDNGPIFRIDGWPIALLIDERARALFKRLEITGISFKELKVS